MAVDFKIIDLDYLLELSNGDKQFVLDMLSCFQEDVPQYIAKIEEMLTSNNATEFKYYVHKLRSPFAFMGIHKGLEILEVLEDSSMIESKETRTLFSEINSLASDALSEVKVANVLV